MAAEERARAVALEVDPGAEVVMADPERIDAGAAQPAGQRHPPRAPGRPVRLRALRDGRRGALRGARQRAGHRPRAPAAHLREVLPGAGRAAGRRRARAVHRPGHGARRTAGRSGWRAGPARARCSGSSFRICRRRWVRPRHRPELRELSPLVLLALAPQRGRVDPEDPRGLVQRGRAGRHPEDVLALDLVQGERTARAPAPWPGSRRSARGTPREPSVSAGQTMAARSTALRSSRTFPGQG